MSNYRISKEKEKTDEEINGMGHPFQDDLLERKEIAETIANIISNTKSSYVYNINSPYGTGKTFFLKRLKCLLQRKGCKVVFYNSWENDLLENPFIPLTQEIINALDLDDKKYKQLIEALSKAAVGVISNYNIITKIAYNMCKRLKDNKETNVLLQQYKQTKDLINRFKDSLAKVALYPERPLVIIAVFSLRYLLNPKLQAFALRVRPQVLEWFLTFLYFRARYLSQAFFKLEVYFLSFPKVSIGNLLYRFGNKFSPCL